MSLGSIQPAAGGVLLLAGVLDYRTGGELRERGRELIAHAPSTVTVDCAAVEHASSVGLALLLAFMRDARKAGKALSVRNVPARMMEIAQVYELDELLAG